VPVQVRPSAPTGFGQRRQRLDWKAHWLLILKMTDAVVIEDGPSVAAFCVEAQRQIACKQ